MTEATDELQKHIIAWRKTNRPLVEFISPLPIQPQTGECVLGVESTHGARLRIWMKNAPPSGLGAIIQEFAG